MNDANKKTQRSFQCRDVLWHKFEHMAQELECSIDYLINDAMKQYARQRGYSTTSVSSSSMAVPPSSVHGAPPPPPPPRAPSSAPAASVPVASASPLPPTPNAPPPTPGGMAPAPPPAPASLGGARVASGSPPTLPRRPPAPPPSSAVRPPPAPSVAPPPLHGAPPPRPTGLKIYYQGEAFPVTKDRFVIGRGKQTSDLTIKDPNVSRQHAMVEFSGGQYYMVDLGSTNGIEFNGQRVQRKVIQDGDVFRICDYELRVSFH